MSRLRKAVSLQQAGRLDEAEQIYASILNEQPEQPVALNFLGVLRAACGDHEDAVRLIERAVKVAPGYVEAHANLASPLLALGRAADAKNAALAALQYNPDHIAALVQLGTAEMRLGELDSAMKRFALAVRLNPNNAAIHLRLGYLLRARQMFERAEEHYLKAIELAPRSAEAHHGLGLVKYFRKDPPAAAASINRAITLKPSDHRLYLDLFFAHESVYATREMRAAIDEALKLAPGDSNVLIANAITMSLEDNDDGALALLENVADEASVIPPLQMKRFHLAGEILERRGDYEKSFVYYEKTNRLLKELPEYSASMAEQFAENLLKLQQLYTKDWVNGWTPVAPSGDRASPIFLVGFPRSGTTLLEIFLRGHDQFAVLEERPMANAIVAALDQLPGGGADSLSILNEEGLTKLRAAYFGLMDQLLPPHERSKKVIDKQPMNMAQAGLLHRVFPDAKFIFMERDPRDCVFSAFAQRFELNPQSANFLDLENTAMIYDRSLTLWTQYKELFGLEVCTVRYEGLVEDPETHLRRLIAYLDEDWRDDVLDHVETVRRQKIVKSASQGQVRKELYATSRERWRRFEKQMEPVRPVLDKWAERLGYPV